MLRFALIALASIIVLLIGIALVPKTDRGVPSSTIHLQNAEVTLYPQADPEAIWYFNSPMVEYQPDLRETTLFELKDAKRTLNDKADFTLEAEKVTIGSEDNLRGDAIFVHLIEEDWDLDMQARNERQVLINQREGKFEVPHVSLTGDGAESVYENMRISFDLTDFESGGEGTVGYSSFEIGDSREE